MLRKAALVAAVVPFGSCTVLQTADPTAPVALATVAQIASLELADSLIASGDADERARGYAMRSLMHVDGSDHLFRMSGSMATSEWWPLLPFGLVYDTLCMPAQWWHHLRVTDIHRARASRDVDEARRLGARCDEHGNLRLFDRTFVPIDKTTYYVPADAGRRIR
jgi:hypothetical protein